VAKMKIKEIALIMLKEAYGEMEKKGFGTMVNAFEIGKKYNITQEQSETAMDYLNVKGLADVDADGAILITKIGIDAYEKRNTPNTPLYQMNQYMIKAEGSIFAGDIQQGSSNIMQKLTYEQIFQKLELEITNSNLKDEEKKTLLFKLKELLSHPLIVELLKRVIFGQSLI
jgi:hypothetical protein